MADAPALPRPGLLALLAGALAACGQPPFGFVPLAFAGYAILAVLILRAPGPRAAFRRGWLFGSAHFALALHWIVEPFLVDIARHGWMAPFALAGLAAGLALFWGGAAALAARVAPGRFGLALALAATLTLAEWLRGWVFTGFPWASVGHIWIDTGHLRLAAVFGATGLTLVTVLLAGLLASALHRRPKLVPVAGLALGVALWVAGGGLPTPADPLDPEATTIRLIQPNAPQHQKWDPDHVLTFYQRQLDFTAAPGSPDLVIWPETSVPWSGVNAATAFEQISDVAGGSPVVVGWQRRAGDDVFNSLSILGPGGVPRDTYDKHHLVPFGEYVPFAPLAERLGLRGLAARALSGFSAGPGPATLDLGALGRGLPLICYELIFQRNIRAAPERPDLLLHLTNDAWFGETAGPQQHLAQARLRAAEFGLPVIRAANTGISAVIDGRGEVIRRLRLGTAGFLDANVPPPLPPTLYARTGNGPVLGVALVLLFIAMFTGSRKAD